MEVTHLSAETPVPEYPYLGKNMLNNQTVLVLEKASPILHNGAVSEGRVLVVYLSRKHSGDPASVITEAFEQDIRPINVAVKLKNSWRES